MNYIYHNVPEPMIGTKLIPLSAMPEHMATTRSINLEKYTGREEVLERQIPLLNCAWNDVLQFMPVHPQKVFDLQVKMGIIPSIPHYKFFKIPVDSLDQSKLAVYFKTAPGEENTTVTWLKDVEFSSLTEIPEATINYYESLIGSDELPFNYQFIPHVLYKGILDTSEIDIFVL